MRRLDKIDDGAVTASYRADREKVIDVLNEVLLARQEDHADDMAKLLSRVSK